MNLSMETVKHLSQLHELGQTALMLLIQHAANVVQLGEKCFCCGRTEEHSEQCEVAIIYAKVAEVREEHFRALAQEAGAEPSLVDETLARIQPLPLFKTEPAPPPDTK